MKKETKLIVSMWVAVGLVFAISGCGNKTPERVEKRPIEVREEATTPIFKIEKAEEAKAETTVSDGTTYKLTAYCSCEKCCGKSNGITATGTQATAGRTVAVDPSIIPYGSTVEIDGLGTFVAEDCGGAVKGNVIDIYFNSHEEAVNFGVQYRDVKIVPVLK